MAELLRKRGIPLKIKNNSSMENITPVIDITTFSKLTTQNKSTSITGKNPSGNFDGEKSSTYCDFKDITYEDEGFHGKEISSLEKKVVGRSLDPDLKISDQEQRFKQENQRNDVKPFYKKDQMSQENSRNISNVRKHREIIIENNAFTFLETKQEASGQTYTIPSVEMHHNSKREKHHLANDSNSFNISVEECEIKAQDVHELSDDFIKKDSLDISAEASSNHSRKLNISKRELFEKATKVSGSYNIFEKVFREIKKKKEEIFKKISTSTYGIFTGARKGNATETPKERNERVNITPDSEKEFTTPELTEDPKIRKLRECITGRGYVSGGKFVIEDQEDEVFAKDIISKRHDRSMNISRIEKLSKNDSNSCLADKIPKKEIERCIRKCKSEECKDERMEHQRSDSNVTDSVEIDLSDHSLEMNIPGGKENFILVQSMSAKYSKDVSDNSETNVKEKSTPRFLKGEKSSVTGQDDEIFV